MSNLETLLTAWLNDGEVPAGFRPETRIEEYLVAILEGVDDSVTPKSRADVLLDAIATKYAGYADGLEDLQDVTGITEHHVPGADNPGAIAAFLRLLNTLALQDLAAKGATGVNDNTTDILDAYANLPSGGGGVEYSSAEYDAATNTYTLTEKDDPTITHTLTCSYDAQGRINGMVYDDKNIAVTYNNDGTAAVGGTTVDVSEYADTGGASLNIAYGDTAPEDTSKLWVKTAQPQNVTVDYDIDNGVESIETLTTVLPNAAWSMGSGTVGKKCYLFGGMGNNRLAYINVFDTETNAITTLTTLLPTQMYYMACGVVGTKIFLFGGYGSGTMNTINVFDTETNAITTLPTALPNAAYAIGCGVVGTKIYLFGGNYGGYLDTINVFDTETNTISTLSSVTLPTAASHIACGVVGAKCYLFGGNSSNGRLNTIRVFDAATNTITTLAATIPSAASSIACGVVGTKIYLFGGLGNAIAVFDTETEICTTLSTTLPIAASAIACGVVGANCYLFGGIAGSSNLNTIDKFTVTFPLNEGDVYLQEDIYKNKFTLVTAPTEVKTGVSAVYVGNASNEAEYAEARLYNSTSQTWELIT